MHRKKVFSNRSFQNIDIIFSLDIPQQTVQEGKWGTFRINGAGQTELIASPDWGWGAFYIQLIRSYSSREWDASVFGKRENHAVNYC